jgi:hypothetical protein
MIGEKRQNFKIKKEVVQNKQCHVRGMKYDVKWQIVEGYVTLVPILA